MKKKKNTVLILDDEPQYLQWLVEYVQAKDYEVELVSSLDEAERQLRGTRYSFIIVDLNVPSSDAMKASLARKNPAYLQYAGLYAAELARNMGHVSRQVVVYSVHDAEEVRNLSERIGFTYIIKGRPREFKSEIDALLGYKDKPI